MSPVVVAGGATMGDLLKMSQKERQRLVEINKVVCGEQRIVDAAFKLGVSYRQMKRVLARFRKEGDAGLCHRNRGRPSNRGKCPKMKAEVITIYQEQFLGWGPTLAAEKLSGMGHEVNHETLRRWLLALGLWKRARKRKPYRRWRERKSHFGELVQIDGSPHDWFGTGQKVCLMDMVDDATGKGVIRFFAHETTEAAMVVTREWVRKYGIPCALYSDHHTIYHTGREPSFQELESGKIPLTAFGKACEKVGIEIIPASSPQAKGRVERRNGVLQDRLAKELQWKRIRTIKDANAFLDRGYMEGLNKRLEQEPESPVDYHRPLLKGTDLNAVFAFEETRKVNNDWTVLYNKRVLQITGPGRHVPPAKSTVLVQERLDGSLHLYYRGQPVPFKIIPFRPAARKPVEAIPKARKPWIPPPDHPWRHFRIAKNQTKGMAS
jgi:transposase